MEKKSLTFFRYSGRCLYYLRTPIAIPGNVWASWVHRWVVLESWFEAQTGPLGQDRGGSRKRYNRPVASMEASTQCTFRQSGRITQFTHFEQCSSNWTDIKQSLPFSFQSLRDRGSLVAARDNVEVGVVNDLNSQLKRVEHELASIRSAHWRNSILVAFWKQSSIFV